MVEDTLSEEAQSRLRRQLIVYFLTTFAVSWSIFAAALAFGLDQSPVVILGVWGPSLSAILVTAMFYGPGGLKRFFGRFKAREGLKWIVPLLGFFLAIGLTGHFIGAAATGIEFTPQFWGWTWAAQVMVMQLLIPGIGEEFGWRGFALQRLQHITTPIKATLVIAFFHLLWHAPTYWLGQGMHNVPAISRDFRGCAQLHGLSAGRRRHPDFPRFDHDDVVAGWPDGTVPGSRRYLLGDCALYSSRRLWRPGHSTRVRAPYRRGFASRGTGSGDRGVTGLIRPERLPDESAPAFSLMMKPNAVQGIEHARLRSRDGPHRRFSRHQSNDQ